MAIHKSISEIRPKTPLSIPLAIPQAILLLTIIVPAVNGTPALAMTPMDDLGVLLTVVLWGGPLSLIGIFTAIWIALRRNSTPPAVIGIANAILTVFLAMVATSRIFNGIASRHAMLHEPGPSFFSMKMAKLMWPWCIPLFLACLPVMLTICFRLRKRGTRQAGPVQEAGPRDHAEAENHAGTQPIPDKRPPSTGQGQAPSEG